MAGTDIVQVKPHLFQKGHAKMGGRRINRFGGDLREAVVAASSRSASWRRTIRNYECLCHLLLYSYVGA